MVQDGPRWSKMVKNGQKWSKMVINGHKWSKNIQIVPQKWFDPIVPTIAWHVSGVMNEMSDASISGPEL